MSVKINAMDLQTKSPSRPIFGVEETAIRVHAVLVGQLRRHILIGMFLSQMLRLSDLKTLLSFT